MKKIMLVLIFGCLPLLSQADQVSRADWVAGMETALPAAFCSRDMYFRQCFSIDAVECEEVAASVTRLCLKKHQGELPAILNQPEDGGKWGYTIGACAGGAFEAALSNKRINNAKCNDASNWQ